MEKLKTFVDILPSISLDLDRMTHLTAELRLHASQLNDGLRGVKRELLISLTECKADECREVLDKYQIGKLDANEIDYNKVIIFCCCFLFFILIIVSKIIFFHAKDIRQIFSKGMLC